MGEIGTPDQLTLLRDFAIIMAVAGGAVILFKRLRLPSILGYLVAGVLVGPFTFPSPPITNIEIVRLLADLGLVLLLFAVGMEFGWRRIRQVGFGILVIGTIEMAVMVTVGYQLGKLLGWSPIEAVYLGSAMSISSSAILIKVLRDSGRLATRSGKLIVGLLVVEDFVAVIMLTLLSGVAASGATDMGDVGPVVLKLLIFTIASVALGALFVPRLIAFIHQFHSQETLVLAALALCFSLALLGQELGLSAAAGAFLIGAVIGDTREAEQMTKAIAPIRDMFGALFFVSIGMLIDIRVIQGHLLPALVISLVFVVGKVAANTFGAAVTGQPGRVPLRFGMGTPQMGEFSLAMVKTGVEHQAIGAFVYQVMAAVTVITSVVYPYIAGSADRVADLFARRSPEGLGRHVGSLSVGARRPRPGLSIDPEFRRRIRGPVVSVVVNFLIVVVLIAIGALGVGMAPGIADPTGISKGLLGNTIAFAALALTFPSAMLIWKNLERLAQETTVHVILRDRPARVWAQGALQGAMRDSAMILLMFVLGLWAIPLVAEVLSLGPLAVPLPFLVVAGLVYVATRFLGHVHGHLFEAFSRTFFDDRPADADPAAVGGTDGRRVRPEVTLRSEYAPPLTPPPESRHEPTQLELPLSPGRASTEPPRRAVSIADAEISALNAVESDVSPYAARMGQGTPLAWEFKEAVEVDGHYLVTLRFRVAGSPPADYGEESVYVDRWGDVRERQIRSWPGSARHGLPVPVRYAGAAVALAVATGLVYVIL